MSEAIQNPRFETFPVEQLDREDTFTALVMACAEQLEEATWRSNAREGDWHKRWKTVDNSGYIYRITQFGRETADGIEPNDFCVVAIERATSNERVVASFDVDAADGEMRAIYTHPHFTSQVGEDNMAHMRHLIDIFTGGPTTEHAKKERQNDQITTLRDHFAGIGWLRPSRSGVSKVVCVQRANDRDSIMGLRFAGDNLVIEHLHLGGETLIRTKYDYNGNGSRQNFVTSWFTNHGAPIYMPRTEAEAMTSAFLTGLLRDIEENLIDPMDTGPRDSQFHTMDFIDFVRATHNEAARKARTE